MKSTTRSSLSVIAIVLAVAAIYFGQKWNSVSQATPGVTVHYRDGGKDTGVFSKSWSGDYTLRTADGRVVLFHDFILIEIEGSKTDFSSAMLASWRLYLSASAAVALLLAVLVATAISKSRRDEPGSPAGA